MNVYERYGVKPVVNVAGAMTRYGGTIVGQQVLDAMASAYAASSGPLAERLVAALRSVGSSLGPRQSQQAAALLVVRAGAGYRAADDREIDLRVDDHAEPLQELRRLVRLQRAYNHANRGDELMAGGEVEDALRQYASAAGLAPEILELPFWQAVTLASAGREAEAMPIFAAVFAREPQWAALLPRLPAAGLLPEDPALIERILSRATAQE